MTQVKRVRFQLWFCSDMHDLRLESVWESAGKTEGIYLTIRNGIVYAGDQFIKRGLPS